MVVAGTIADTIYKHKFINETKRKQNKITIRRHADSVL